MTGIEFLQWLRKEDMTLPTVVLSSSNFPADIREAYRLGADGYVVKPTELEDIRKVGQAIADFLARPGGGIEPFIAKFAVPRPRALRSVETSGIRRPS
jgi:DNA-binding NarL/FixJ family response regulator